MAVYKDKDLSQNVEAFIKPRASQVMLSNIIQKTEFNAFFEGRNKVKIFMPDKSSVWGEIGVGKGQNPKVWLELESASEECVPDAIILIIFPLGKANYIAQCSIVEMANSQVFIKALDPRISERIKTMIHTAVHPVSKETLVDIEKSNKKIKRTIEYKDAKKMANPYMAKDWFTVAGNNIQDPSADDGVFDPIKAIVADVSKDGCCLCIPDNVDTSKIFESNILYLDMTLPSLTYTKTAQIFVLVRANRRLDKMTVFHCMFLEPIPTDYLVI